MEYKYCSNKYIWSAHDSFFYKGLSELILDIEELIYLSPEKIKKRFCFYQYQHGFFNRLYQAR